MSSILIVDDVEANRLILKNILEEEYDILEAKNGEEAIDIIFNIGKTLRAVLLDIIMPDMDGFEVLRKIKENPQTENIPVLFITAADADMNEIRGLSEGAVDYITKPFDPRTVMVRVQNQIKQSRDREMLEVQLERKTYELIKTHERTLETLASIIEYRSLESGLHIKRTIGLMKVIVNHLFTNPRYRDEMDAEFCRYAVRAVALHDIGKIGIPDEILLKPGKLTRDEFEIIKQHTLIGSEIIDSIALGATDGIDYLNRAREICRSHHERWDGTGYPDKLKQENIPLAARIAAIIDVYDALVSVRCYKAAYSHEEALSIMNEGCGTQFDPYILAEFLSISDAIAAV